MANRRDGGPQIRPPQKGTILQRLNGLKGKKIKTTPENLEG